MAEKRILPLPPYLRFLLDVPSVANAEITSQETLMALDKNKDKKDKKKVPGNKDQGPETPSEPPEDPRDPMTGLPYDILGELFDIAKEIEKKSGTPKTTEIKVEEKNLDKFNEELSNVKVSDQIADFEDDQYGNIGTRGFTEEVAQEIYQAEGYDEYQKKIQEVVRGNLGDTFTVYRGTTTDEFDLEAGEPITRAGVSVTLNPKEAESFVSGKLSLPKKSGDPVLLKITASPEMVVMRGADSGELVLDGYSLNQSNIEIIPIKEEKKPYTVTYTISGKPITDQDLAKEVSKLSTQQLNKERRYYLNAFNDPTSALGPGRWKRALEALPTMPQGLTLRDFMSPKWNKKINVNNLRMYGAHARLDAIMDELRKREDFDPSAVQQESFDDLLSASSYNLTKIKEAEKQVKYFRDRGLDEEADKLENQIADFKIKNNI